MFRILFALFLAFAVTSNLDGRFILPSGIGNQLHHGYTSFLSENIEGRTPGSGWTCSSTCDANLGKLCTYGNTKDNAFVMYMTASGYIAGIGADVYGSIPSPIKKYWPQVGHSHYRISISFRAPTDMCDSSFKPNSTMAMGDRLVVNQGSNDSVSLPTTADEAVNHGWHKGSCFADMGRHYFYDVSLGNGKMSWDANNLFPISVMFDEGLTNPSMKGLINAVFFTSADVQQTVFPPSDHWWDAIPLINYLMCKNLCDSSCGWKHTDAFSTMHVFFRDYKQVTCAGGCSIGCCP